MESITRTQIEAFLTAVGERCEPESTIFLLGGVALELLGGSRPTIDLDYVGHDLELDGLQELMVQIADDMKIEDIVFLIQHKFVSIEQLADYVEQAILQARQFSLDPATMPRHLDVVRQSL